MAIDSISFAEATGTPRSAPNHLLLGNGFSIDVHPAFGYPNLFREAVKLDPSIGALFPDPTNPNFEDALREATSPAAARRIRIALIQAVTAAHPYYSLSLSEDDRQSCREFLEKFSGRHLKHPGWVFTTNYDLLLHWVVSTQPASPGTKPNKPLKLWDGFETNGLWREHGDAQVFYLHGAVHIRQEPYNALRKKFRTEMLRYERKRPLIAQVNAHLARNDFPAFVAEGTSHEKLASLRDYHYLKRARRILQRACNADDGAIFTFGHSFGQSDDHISSVIGGGNIPNVYIGVFSDRDRARAEELAGHWTQQRAEGNKKPITVLTFDTRECRVWQSTRR